MPIILYLVYSLLGLAQIAAYLAGVQLWLGIGPPLGLLIFFVTAIIIPFGSFINAAIGFYGAYSALNWPWLQADLLTFPFAIVGVFVMGLSSIFGIAVAFHRRNAE